MTGRTERFLQLSAKMTGYGRLELYGTGMVEEYLRALDETLPAGLLDEMLAVADQPSDGADASRVLGDPKLGPVAENLIVLWYTGTWNAMPDDWRAAHGASPMDRTRVVSANSYRAGLQWVAAGAHPAGSDQQGFGAWALAPGGADDERRDVP